MVNQTIKLDKFSYVEEAKKAFEPAKATAENENKKIALKEKIKHSDLSPDKLLTGLYFIFDAFERASIDFFLIRQTAKDTIKGIFEPLTGDHIDIGIRSNEWANDSKDILFSYFDGEHVEITRNEPALMECKWQDVPFTIHFYPDNPCITALIPVTYQYENFNIPNRFDIFEEKYDK